MRIRRHILDAPDVTGRFTYIMLKLHTDMFAGLPGKLFLGLMGILFCVAIISGIVVYAPSMRKLKFGDLPQQAHADRAMAGLAQPGRHLAGDVDAGGRLYRRDQHLGRSGGQDVAVRPACRNDRAIPRSGAACAPGVAALRRRCCRQGGSRHAAELRGVSGHASSAARATMRSSCVAIRRSPRGCSSRR